MEATGDSGGDEEEESGEHGVQRGERENFAGGVVHVSFLGGVSKFWAAKGVLVIE
jgi:hypothetical protein